VKALQGISAFLHPWSRQARRSLRPAPPDRSRTRDRRVTPKMILDPEVALRLGLVGTLGCKLWLRFGPAAHLAAEFWQRALPYADDQSSTAAGCFVVGLRKAWSVSPHKSPVKGTWHSRLNWNPRRYGAGSAHQLSAT